ncbi:MAG TPA: autotransporter-associated beta strand repeat-containing protein [Verrucomicrobiae bacterium]|nr:autotransporter-associated beta strand repeat-containing protein [Verrucomicrobiae bacterium]
MQTNPNYLSYIIKPKAAFVLLVLLAILLTAPGLRAQSGTWTNLVNGNASGTWSTPANWLNGVVANGGGNTADFSTLSLDTNSTVTLDTARTIGNLIFGNTGTSLGTNWILTGSTLTLQVSAGAPSITANNGTNVISAVLAGTEGFTKAGVGAIRLTAANNTTLSSNISLNVGILQVGNNNALGATTPNGSATLSNAVVVASNTATLWILPGIQPNFKPIFASGAGVGGTQGAIYADLSSLANNNNSTRLDIGLTTTTSPAVTMLGDTTIRVDGTNATALGSVLLIGHITTSNAVTGLPANYDGYTLSKTGGGRLSIDPASGYSGGNIHVVQGGLRFGNNSDLLASQTVTVDAGAGLFMGNVTSMNSLNSTLVINGLLDLDARGNGTAGSDTTIATQTIGYLSGSGIVTNGGAGNIGANTLVIGGTNGTVATFSGTIPQCANGSVGLRLQNTNSTLILSGNNTYTGTTVLNAGTLLVDGSHIGGGAYTVNSGATLGGSGVISAASLTENGGTIIAGDPASPGSTLTLSNSITGTSSGALIISNANLSISGQIGAGGQTIGTLYMDNGALQIPLPTSGTPSVFTTAFNVDGGVTIVFTTATPLKGQFPLISYSSIGGVAGFSGLTLSSPPGVTAYLSNNVANSTIDIVITGIPALIWNGNVNGNWDIGTTANWQGGLTYTDGTNVLFDDTASGTTTVNLTTTLSPGGVTVNNSTLSYTFTGSGQLSGAGGILKRGSGTLTVANSGNNLTGGVTLDQGTVQVGNGGTTGNLGSGAIVNQGTLALDRADTFALGNTVSGNGAITQSGTGTATVPVSGNSTGAVTANAGTLLLGPVGVSTFSGAVTGAGAFGLNGAGTLILTTLSDTYSGGTVISNGTLLFSGALPPTGNIADNGTLALAVSGTLANNVSGSGGLTVVSNANVTLGGNNAYTGPTMVKGLAGSTVNTTAANYPAASILTLGNQSGSGEFGSVNFTAGNPVIGGLNVGATNTSANAVNLSAGNQTLTVNGNVTVGAIGPSGAHVFLPVNGTGSSLIVNTNGGTIQIGLGATGSGVNPDFVLVDLSGANSGGAGVNNFIANLGTNGTCNLGTLDGNPGPTAGATAVDEFILANVSNSITAGAITIGPGGRQLTPDLRLGPGTNIFNVGALNIGTGGRDGGQMEFNTGSGGLQVRAATGGSSAADYNQGVNTNTSTGAGFTTTVDFTGGNVDLLFDAMVIGNEPARAGTWNNTFTFSQGILNAASVSLSQGARSNADYSIMNLNGGLANLGTVSLTASVGAGTLNINNATVTVSNITYSGTGTATLSLNNATLNVDIPGFGNPAAAPITAGSFSASGAVNLGVNGSGFTVGQFPLISYSGSIGGSGFAVLNLNSLPTNVSGYLSNNTANASVDLVITSAPPAVNPNPTNIVFSVTGSGGSKTLNLSWPSDHLGWTLLTNSVGLAVANQWYPYPGSSSVTNVSLPISTTKTNVFFRLAYPYP